MPVPKSVVKINKKGVEYISSCDKYQYYIFELSRAALRDVGKFVRRKFIDSYYQHFGKLSRKAGRAISYNVFSNANTIYPHVDIGLKNTKIGFYSLFQEFGSSKAPKLGLLSKAVQSNIDEIIKIESQYLSALENETGILGLIDENEMSGDDAE